MQFYVVIWLINLNNQQAQFKTRHPTFIVSSAILFARIQTKWWRIVDSTKRRTLFLLQGLKSSHRLRTAVLIIVRTLANKLITTVLNVHTLFLDWRKCRRTNFDILNLAPPRELMLIIVPILLFGILSIDAPRN